MPLAGMIAWVVIGVAGAALPTFPATMVLFIGAGSIIYLGMFISRFTGEHFLDRSKQRNVFDGLFFYTVAMALLVFSIAIPYFLVDHTSLPLTVGILTGLMWLPMSWLIEHWIGIFHAVARTLAIVAAWYLWPDLRFVAIPIIIVLIYGVSIVVLERRWRRQRTLAASSNSRA
jgi:hypothetical protein